MSGKIIISLHNGIKHIVNVYHFDNKETHQGNKTSLLFTVDRKCTVNVVSTDGFVITAGVGGLNCAVSFCQISFDAGLE